MRWTLTLLLVLILALGARSWGGCPAGTTVTVGAGRDVATIQAALDCLDGVAGFATPGTVLIDGGTYDGFWMLDGTVGPLTARHSFITVAAREPGTVDIRPLLFSEVPVNAFGARGNVGVTLVGAIREVTLRGLRFNDTHFSIHTQIDDLGKSLQTLLVDRCALESTATPSQQGQAQDLLVLHVSDDLESHVTIADSSGTITFGGLTIATGTATVVSRNNRWHLRAGDSSQKTVYRTTSQFPPARFEVSGDVITSDTLTSASRVVLLDHVNVKSLNAFQSVLSGVTVDVETGAQGVDLIGVAVDTTGFGPRFASFVIAESEVRLTGGAGTTCAGIQTEKKGGHVRVYDSSLSCLGAAPIKRAVNNACAPGACGVYLYGSTVEGNLTGDVIQVHLQSGR